MTHKRLLREVDTPEWAMWVGLYEVEADERKRAEAKARTSRGRSRRR